MDKSIHRITSAIIAYDLNRGRYYFACRVFFAHRQTDKT